MESSTLTALAQPNRLRIVELLRERPRSVAEITERLSLGQPQVSKHLRVLSEAGIVQAKRVAQMRIYQLQPQPFQELEAWLGTFRPTWNDRMDTLEEYLNTLRPGHPSRGSKKR
jgi:DNA-binding transcriptional ArsR family regulator